MTRMLAVILALSLTGPAWGADDAPTAAQPLAPDVVCYGPGERANIAKALVAKDARIASLEKEAGVPTLLVVGLIVLGVVAGGAAGYGFAVATAPK